MTKRVDKHFKKRYLAMAITLFVSGQAFAEEQTTEQVEEQRKKGELEVILVTSQKRVQNLQEVPIAVTAIGGEVLAEGVIKDVFDLKGNVPAFNVNSTQSATQTSFAIRGIGTSSQNYGLESSVGLYSDGVYRSRQNSMINNYVDVESVEILRGPQGTLFGKNTPMGAVNIRTVAPEHGEHNGFVEMTAGNYGLFSYSGATNIGLIDDTLTARVTGFGTVRDGFVSDVNFGEDTINDRDRFGGRLQFLYTPSDDLSVRIIADYAEIDEVCCGVGTQVSNAQAIGIPGKMGTDVYLSSPLFNGTLLSGDEYFDYNVSNSFLPESTSKDTGVSAEINWTIDEQLSLVSISALRDFNSFDHTDSDFSDVDLFSKVNDAEQKSFSQELRLEYKTDRLNAIGGLYYFTQDLDVDGISTMGTDINSFFLNGLLSDLNPLLTGINQISQMTGGAVAPVAAATPGNTQFSALAEQEHESYAIFGQFDYKITDQLTLTAGLRYTCLLYTSPSPRD